MGIDFETAMVMQKICTGETKELSRGQIVGEVIDIEDIVRGFNKDKAEKCRAYFNELAGDREKKMYDVDMLLEETDSIKRQFDDFLKSNSDDDSFQDIFDAISEFFMTPPFEGLDSIEYGVNEVCVFSVLEYFRWKTTGKSDHAEIRKEYRDSIAMRTYEEVAEHWMGVYEELQKRYEKLDSILEGEGATEGDAGLMNRIAACGIVTISAIRDQDAFALDMVQTGAVEKGKSIAAEYVEDTYQDGESAFTDNVVKLLEFIWRYLKG